MLDRNSSLPLHIQMETLIREKLDSGEWAPGQMISSENELSSLFGISRMTVRKVITKLVHEELLDRVPGKGTFVRPQKISANPLSYAGIREQLEAMGYEVSTKLLSFAQVKGDHKLCRRFGLNDGALFHVVKRIRFVKGVPLSLHTSYIPISLCSDFHDTDLEKEQLCVILNERYGYKPFKTEETLESVAATESEAALLAVGVGHPLLLLEDTTFNAVGQAYEFSKVVFRGDKIILRMSY